MVKAVELCEENLLLFPYFAVKTQVHSPKKKKKKSYIHFQMCFTCLN